MNQIDKQKFTELILANKTAMYRLAYGILRSKADAEDAVSETVLKAYEHLGDLKKPELFKSWIMQIVSNVSKTMLRRNSRVSLTDDISCFEAPAVQPDTELWNVVMGLENDQREILILFYYEGFTVKEIASILHVPQGTVKSRLSRAREKLKLQLCVQPQGACGEM